MSNVVAFPGVILAERETGSVPPAPVRCARRRSGQTTAK